MILLHQLINSKTSTMNDNNFLTSLLPF